MIIHHTPFNFDLTSTDGGTVEVGSYNLSTNKLGRVDIDLIILDIVSGNVGSGKFSVYFHRFGGSAVVDRQGVLLALTTPGTLAGASVNTSASGNAVTSTFTGVAGRTIRVMATFHLTTIQD